MEVAVAEEKRKIFRARKTMKISDRQQLETLHNTLLTGNPPISNPSPPPLVNGTHKEDGRKTVDKEQNEAMDSNSSHAPSPVSLASQGSPIPSLSLNLSPSPSASQSPKANEENPSTSPFHSLNFDLKKMEEGKKESLSSPSNDGPVSVSTEPKEGQDKGKEQTTGKVKAEKKEEPHPTAENKVKDSASQSPVLPAISAKKSEKDHRTEPRCAEPMETNRDTKEAKVPDVKPKRKMENVSRTKATTSCSPRSSSPTCPSSSCPVPSSSMVPDQDEGIKDEEKVVELKGELKESMKEKETVGKEELKKVSKVEKMDVDLKVETKTEKNKPRQSAQASRPSSTPPSDTASQEKSSTSGLKRTLSEGDEKNKPNIERDVKRPKVEGMALEAQLELKITAKAGSRLKVEKIVQQLMEDRLRVLQFTVFDKSLQELKDRVEKIDCATKHQTTIKTLQAKMARLTKKFGEANQISENTRKQDALVTAAAAAAAAASTKTAAAASTKTATAANTPQSQRVLRRQTVEPQPEAPKEGLAPSVGKTPALSVKKKMKEEKEKEKEVDEEGEEEEENPSVPRRIAVAERLSEHSEGKCRGDIKLRSISSHMERMLYYNSKRSSGKPRAYRYASYIFRNLVPYEIYCDWVSKVNYVGLMGKDALPVNVRKTLRMYVERRFTELSCERWREIRDSINEILRVKRKPEFFRSCEERTTIYS